MTNSNIGTALVHELCVVCTKEMNESILINKRLTKSMADKVEAMHQQATGFADKPCPECLEAIGDGAYIIEVNEQLTEDMSNPYRTGKLWGLKKDFFERLFSEDEKMLKRTLEKQACYVPIEVCDQLGLPKES